MATSQMFASAHGANDIIRLLVQNEADVNAKNDSGNTA